MTHKQFTDTPAPPYFAVIFSSLRTAGDNGYREMAARIVELASRQPGFLGAESTRGQDGFGITVSYWESQAAIQAWRVQLEHKQAQALGIEKWYDHFELRVAKVERAYGKSTA
jgi:heme-degrading monooxygenase HmoA